METRYSVESVMKLEVPNFLFFGGHTASVGKITKACLSQWWMCEFVVDGVLYNCAEQYMMASKALCFGDEESYRKILLEKDPQNIKGLGRKIKDYSDEIWDRHKYDVVKRANIAKFFQNKDLKEFLLATGDAILVEASPYDKIWGIGMKENDKDVLNPSLWKGSNLLGFALMEVRDILREEDVCYLDCDVADKIRGCLMAGAAGDALGYEVEFMSYKQILSLYGERGITQFVLGDNNKALVSDDTQMTLFTANGLLLGITRCSMRGIGGPPESYVSLAYGDWYYTQNPSTYHEGMHKYTWLLGLLEMAHRRAPGITCLTACESIINNKEVKNNSKGCGGIMRVAPISLLMVGHKYQGVWTYSLAELANAGAEIAKVTHKHPLGFLPAALLSVFIYKLAFLSIEEIKRDIDVVIEDTLSVLNLIYEHRYDSDKQYLKILTRKVVCLAKSDMADIEAIAELGEGWTAEEAWAISLYCVIRHIDSVEDAIIASVNHDGDSDSTGSITGNIMGVIYGYKHIKALNLFCPQGCVFEDTIELSEIILAMAEDLFTSCVISEWNPIDTPRKMQWYERYCCSMAVGIK